MSSSGTAAQPSARFAARAVSAAEYEEMLAKLRAPLPPGWRIG